MIFGLDEVFASIRVCGTEPGGAQGMVPVAATDALAVQTRRLLDRAARWLITERPAPLDVPAAVDYYRGPVARHATDLRSWTRPARSRPFIEAVEREERAWAAAVGAAERSRDARFSPDERDLLEQARRLLEVVGASEYEQERHTALRQALRKLRALERRIGWQLPLPPRWRWSSGPAGCSPLSTAAPLPNGKGNLSTV